MHIGYTLMTEQSGPRELLRYAVAAEEAGFDFELSSDHFSPWLTEQGHAPNAWVLLGAVAQATSRVELMTFVTCPTMRYHPAVVAQQAATLQLLADGRFTLGLGSGENLNEHVIGEGWPSIDMRHDMLEEAMHIIRELLTGELVTWEGQHFRVDSARLWDVPDARSRTTSSRPCPTVTWCRAGTTSIPAAPGCSGRCRSAGTRTSRRRSSGLTPSSAGSAADGP
jgi:G6PDH family F420-dependent oxidoreductase